MEHFLQGCLNLVTSSQNDLIQKEGVCVCLCVVVCMCVCVCVGWGGGNNPETKLFTQNQHMSPMYHFQTSSFCVLLFFILFFRACRFRCNCFYFSLIISVLFLSETPIKINMKKYTFVVCVFFVDVGYKLYLQTSFAHRNSDTV